MNSFGLCNRISLIKLFHAILRPAFASNGLAISFATVKLRKNTNIRLTMRPPIVSVSSSSDDLNGENLHTRFAQFANLDPKAMSRCGCGFCEEVRYVRRSIKIGAARPQPNKYERSIRGARLDAEIRCDQGATCCSC